MTNEILKVDSFTLFFGVLSKQHFKLAPVWCEYYEPAELDDVNVSEQWLQDNLIKHINLLEERAYYSVAGNIDYSKREFLNIFCDFSLAGLSFQGYLYVIQGKVNSVSIFLEEDVVDLYSSDLLSDDNIETLAKISKKMNVMLSEVSSISYNIPNNPVNFVASEGIFQFPK